eukprot:UN29063
MMYHANRVDGMIGAEWWITATKEGEDVGLHYDKDEGIASTEWWIKFPLLSTLTYLTPFGAPTLVIDQHTDHRGNHEWPKEAKHGWISMPKENRHCYWQSDLHHGVFGASGPLGQNFNNKEHKRLTLAINLWDSVPIYPYSVNPSPAQLNEIGFSDG